jgi:DNA topoisomerase-1
LPPADLTVEKAMAILRAKAEGPLLLGVDPASGQNVYVINGRFGTYVQLGETPEKGITEKPRRSSLTSGLGESTVTLEEALQLLSLPRELGLHPESAQPIVAGLGRYGPYVKHGDDYRSLDSEDDLFTVDLAAALALLAAPKKQGRRRGAAKRVIRQIEMPDGAAPLQVLEGRYGPYVTDGTTNASVPRGTDPATLTLEDARSLLEARAGAPPREGRRAPARPKRVTRGRSARVRPAAAAATGEAPIKKTAKSVKKTKTLTRKVSAAKRASS